MGNYNPYAPIIVGQEWVPIREENLDLAPNLNVIEQGHGFTLAQTRLIHDVRFYTPTFPPGSATGQVFIASIYPRDTEDQTGPIQSVVIPCNSASVTGGTASTTPVQDLMDPSDDISVLLNGDANDKLECFFAVNQYTFLQGKRILGIELLYTAYTQSDTPIESYFATISIRNDAGTSQSFGAPEAYVDTTTVKSVFTRSLGDVNHFALGNPSASSERLPYRYVDLQRFEATSTNTRLRVMFATTSFGDTDSNDNLFIGYAALRVWYCEEKRVAVGAVIFGNVPGGKDFKLGVNDIPMRHISAYTTDPPLVAGDYDVTISAGNPSSFNFGGTTTSSGIYPPIESLRELYEIPPHPGVRVTVPQQVVGNDETFTAEVTHILPHLSVHTTGGAPLTEVHVYGRQVVAPVYGSVYAETEVDDNVVTVAASYPQVRYYARRFGSTSQALVLTNQAVPANTVSITPTEFDVLAEIVDGWKEVTLRFGTPPTIVAAAGSPDWRWTASAETAGNRWEVLGVRAPAVSGIPGNLIQEVPSTQRLGAATYGGAGTNITWQAPPTSGIAEDESADGVILFSLDPPTPTGLEVVVTSQPLTGVGVLCGITSSCAPTGVGYHRVTWGAVSGIIVTGFGAYELQRSDVDTDWQTVMLTTSPSVTGFNDYEARVGVQSSYRLRVRNVYDFAGSWSSTVNVTLTAPGVFGHGNAGTGVLILTTNERQDGSGNLAYVETWDRVDGVKEDFLFPEADTVVLQRMYGKDFQTAFRPLERGGEQFTRTLQLQNAAVSAHVLDRVAAGLRNLAWADVSYVCVRTEDGDRWLATVIVPDATLRKRRELQLARVVIIETTDTPSPVDVAV